MDGSKTPESGLGLAIKDVVNFQDLQERTIRFLADKREQGLQIGFVCGKVKADGKEGMYRNMRRLSAYVNKLAGEISFIFSSTELFPKEVFDRLPEKDLDDERKSKAFRDLSEGILRSGVVDQVYMTPGWEDSGGAVDEKRVADELGLKVTIIKPDWDIAKQVEKEIVGISRS